MDNVPRVLVVWQARWRRAWERPRAAWLHVASLVILLALLATAHRQASLQTITRGTLFFCQTVRLSAARLSSPKSHGEAFARITSIMNGYDGDATCPVG